MPSLGAISPQAPADVTRVSEPYAALNAYSCAATLQLICCVQSTRTAISEEGVRLGVGVTYICRCMYSCNKNALRKMLCCFQTHRRMILSKVSDTVGSLSYDRWILPVAKSRINF